MKSIVLTTLFTATNALTAAPSELIVKEAPFETSLSVDATFIPSNTTIVQIDPEEWSNYRVIKCVAHGSSVKKGDLLISCDREDYDEKIAAVQKETRARKIALAKTKRELVDLELSTPHALESEQITYQYAKEALDHFNQVGRELENRQADQSLESSKMTLKYIEEELKQLLKMYEEDGVTEETEEIILQRQRIAVERATFSYERAQKTHKWAKEKTIPRKALDLKRKHDAALLKYETAKLNLPRTLEQKKISVEKAIKADQDADKKLTQLKKDAAFFTISAPTDGTVYYGGIKEGIWSGGGAEKFLAEKGTLPIEAPLLTIIAPNSTFNLHTKVGQEQRLQLALGNTGVATVAGLAGQTFPSEITQISTAPDTTKKFALALSVALPNKLPIATGMTGTVNIVTYFNEKALTIPTSAISSHNGKSHIKVKLANGKSESREIVLGKSAKGRTEILSGLTNDQVILVPDAKK